MNSAKLDCSSVRQTLYSSPCHKLCIVHLNRMQAFKKQSLITRSHCLLVSLVALCHATNVKGYPSNVKQEPNAKDLSDPSVHFNHAG